MSHTTDAQRLGKLLAPQRNHYYYGELLDERSLQKEQDYLNRKRWLLNRLGLGAGVLCGLQVIASQDGKQVCILPGVAVDGLGREIVVPETWSFDPWQITDCCGQAKETLAPDKAHEVTICLAYRECYADYAPVLVTDCNAQEQCAPGTVVESFCVCVCEISEEPVPPEAASTRCKPPIPPTVDSKVCEALTGAADTPDDRRKRLCENLSGACAAPDEKPCVVLAKVSLLAKDSANPEGKIGSIDTCAYRRMVYSNAALFEMILCLTECCGGDTAATKSLVYVSGDNQEADVNQAVPNPLVVKVLENNTPLANEDVIFDVRAGGGQVGSTAGPLGVNMTIKSDSNGIATLEVWQLGSTPTQVNRVAAKLASGESGEIMFFASTRPLAKRLVMVDGDGQQGVVDQPVAKPLVVKVELQDAAGTPIAGETVGFAMIEGGGKIGDGTSMGPFFQTKSKNDGLAELPVWALGPNPVVNRVQAAIASGSPAEYTFHAVGQSIRENLLVVQKVDFVGLDGSTTPLPSTKDSDRPEFTVAAGIYAIRVTFNKELDPTSLPDGPFDPDTSSFEVGPWPGESQISVTGNEAAFSYGPRGDPKSLPARNYRVTLWADTDPHKPNRLQIKASDGSPLDGDSEKWAYGSDSGDGHAGGDFIFYFDIKSSS